MSDIASWLKSLGLGKYEEVFAANEIDFEVLPELTEQDLEKLAIPLGPRKKLLKVIATLAADDSGTDAAERTTVTPPVERRQLTVMFVDLVGSTALSGQLDPEDMRGLILAYQNAVAGEIGRFEGHIAKFMGDGVLAYFGYPRAHEDEAERAVRTGLALARAIGRLKAPSGESLAVRVGIATGLVVVGDLIGEGAAQEQAVVGGTPNLAARLQGIAVPGQVVISEATRRLLGAGFAIEELGERELKGIGQPVPVFAVSGERTVESRFDAMSGMLLPMVGRDQELGLLHERWQQVRTGDGQGVLLVGEAGIGKSRISRALLDAVAGEPHFSIRYQCSPYHRDSALWPVIQQLTRTAGIAAGDSTNSRLDKLEALAGQAVDDVEAIAPLIASLLGLDGVARYGKLELTAQAQRAQTLEALVRQLLGLAARQPVLMMLEDAHWIDPTTLELIEQCLDRIAAARVMILLTSRPDRQPALGAHPHVTRLTLNRLGRAGAKAIVARLGAERLPSETIDAIIARTDGVPLFVEELTKAVLETGETSVPASLHDSLMARLDRVPEVKEVAQTAACIGREFGFSLLAAVVELAEAELVPALDKLVDAELIFRRGTPPEANYTFKHALVQDTAYESLLRSRRQTLHARIAGVLEALFPETIETEPEVIARHCQAGGLADKAIGYWENAGERAIATFAYFEAIAHLSKGLELVKALPESSERDARELDLLCTLGPALMNSKGWSTDEVGTAYARAMELSKAAGDNIRLHDVLRGIWTFHLTRANLGTALDYGSQILTLAERTRDAGHRLEAHRSVACAHIWRGEFVQARRHFEAGCSVQDRKEYDQRAAGYGHHAGVVCLYLGAQTLWCLGFPDRAVSWTREARELARKVALPYSLAIALQQSAFLHLCRREARLTLELAQEGDAVAARYGFPALSAELALIRGWAMAEYGETEAGLALIREGLDDFASMDLRLNRTGYLVVFAEACANSGCTAEGLAALDEALVLVPGTQERFAEAEIYRVRGELLQRTGEAGAARESEACFQRALDIAREQSAKSWELRAATSLTRLWHDHSKRQEAYDLLAPIYNWFTEGFDTADLKDARALLDELA